MNFAVLWSKLDSSIEVQQLWVVRVVRQRHRFEGRKCWISRRHINQDQIVFQRGTRYVYGFFFLKLSLENMWTLSNSESLSR